MVQQQRAYLPYLEPVDRSLKFLDLGCGRGEFMGLLKEQGIQTLGVDINSRMPSGCVRMGTTWCWATRWSSSKERSSTSPV